MPDQVELIEGTDHKNPLSYRDTDVDGIPDHYEPLHISESEIRRYKRKSLNKAMAVVDNGEQHESGSQTFFVSGRFAAGIAARMALEGCKLNFGNGTAVRPCRIVNVDGRWVSDYIPPELPRELGLVMITGSRGLEAFEQYNREPDNKVFVMSQGGQYRYYCLLYTSPSPRDATLSRMPSSA